MSHILPSLLCQPPNSSPSVSVSLSCTHAHTPEQCLINHVDYFWLLTSIPQNTLKQNQSSYGTCKLCQALRHGCPHSVSAGTFRKKSTSAIEAKEEIPWHLSADQLRFAPKTHTFCIFHPRISAMGGRQTTLILVWVQSVGGYVLVSPETNQLGPGKGAFCLNAVAPTWTQGRTGRGGEERGSTRQVILGIHFIYVPVCENLNSLRWPILLLRLYK